MLGCFSLWGKSDWKGSQAYLKILLKLGVANQRVNRRFSEATIFTHKLSREIENLWCFRAGIEVAMLVVLDLCSLEVRSLLIGQA